MSARFERLASQTRFEGRIVSVREDRFRYEDGGEADREIVVHPGAVAVVCHDEEQLFLVAQPREAIGIPDFLELPAGKFDVAGEPPLETARRELAEEIGKAAGRWEELKVFYGSAGFSNEQVHVWLATDLHDVARPDTGEEERIDLITWPLADLDGLIATVTDAKTLIGLWELRRRREG